MPDMPLPPDFDSAAREVLAFLHMQMGFDLWMVTRTEGEDWIVLQARDHGYGVKKGKVFYWNDSFCSQMVRGLGPRVAPNATEVPIYASAPISSQVAIGAYIGVPLTYGDGSLFGTLCAIHPTAQPDIIITELPLVELLASLLSNILDANLKVVKYARLAERAKTEAMSDELTGLQNRRGWNQLLGFEEQRCQQYGHPACVISIDLDGLKQVNDSQGHAKGDELIRRAGQALRETTRKHDVVARIGGDEFAVLGVECNLAEGEQLMNRIKTALAAVDVQASVGIAMRQPSQGLSLAWETADQQMYFSKRSRFRRLEL